MFVILRRYEDWRISSAIFIAHCRAGIHSVAAGANWQRRQREPLSRTEPPSDAIASIRCQKGGENIY